MVQLQITSALLCGYAFALASGAWFAGKKFLKFLFCINSKEVEDFENKHLQIACVMWLIRLWLFVLFTTALLFRWLSQLSNYDVLDPIWEPNIAWFGTMTGLILYTYLTIVGPFAHWQKITEWCLDRETLISFYAVPILCIFFEYITGGFFWGNHYYYPLALSIWEKTKYILLYPTEILLGDWNKELFEKTLNMLKSIQ